LGIGRTEPLNVRVNPLFGSVDRSLGVRLERPYVLERLAIIVQIANRGRPYNVLVDFDQPAFVESVELGDDPEFCELRWHLLREKTRDRPMATLCGWVKPLPRKPGLARPLSRPRQNVATARELEIACC